MLPSTAYSDVWILVRSDNTKIHHMQQFGLERRYLVVDSASNAVIIRLNANISAHQSWNPLSSNFVIAKTINDRMNISHADAQH